MYNIRLTIYFIIYYYDKDYHAYWVGNEPMIFHCHHYNLFLQNTVKDAGEMFDVETLLIQSAEYVVYHQFVELFGKNNSLGTDITELLLYGYSLFGFGRLHIDEMSEEGAKISAKNEHYSIGYTLKYPIPSSDKDGVSYFTRGFINALFAYIYQKPIFSYSTIQKSVFPKEMIE